MATVFIVVVTIGCLSVVGCTRLDTRLQQHKEQFESLGASTAFIGEAWLSGRVSGTYTRTALEQTFLLVEKERTALASVPQALLDPRGAHLSQAAEQLSRLIALLIDDVRGSDASAARKHLGQIPIVPEAGK